MNHYIFLLFTVFLSSASLFSYNHVQYTLTPPPSETISIVTGPSDHTINRYNPNLTKVIDLAALQNVHPSVLEQLCASMDKQALFENYHLYSNATYLAHIRRQVGYKEFILSLQQKMHKDYYFRKSLRYMVGFEGKSGFQNFIDNEAKGITQEQATQILHNYAILQRNVLSNLSKEYQKQHTIACEQKNKELAERYEQRTSAIQTALNNSVQKDDYRAMVKPHLPFTDPDADAFNNCYGSAVDRQLHEELCATRTSMMKLQNNYRHNYHVQAAAPIINRVTALAKREQNIEKAFRLSDVAYNFVSFIGRAVVVLADGIVQGVSQVATPQHFMALLNVPQGLLNAGESLLHLGIFLADENARMEDLDNAFYASLVSGNNTVLLEKSKDLCQHNSKFHKSLKKLCDKPWEELIYDGAAFATTFILDAIILKHAALFASNKGREMIGQLANAFNSPHAKRCAAEIGSIAKVTTAEGVESACKVVEIIQENPTIKGLGNKTLVQAVQQTTDFCEWNMPEKGRMINGRWYTQHALERMAPDTIQVRAILEQRALKLGKQRGSKEFRDYVQPRGIPLSVVEDVIEHGKKLIDKKAGTLSIESNDVLVIVDDLTRRVITVIPK